MVSHLSSAFVHTDFHSTSSVMAEFNLHLYSEDISHIICQEAGSELGCAALCSSEVVKADSHSKVTRDVRAAAINGPQVIKLRCTVLV